MTDDLATRIRQYYETAAPPVDADEAIERQTARVEEAQRNSLLGWFGGHPTAAVGAAAVVTLLLVGGALWAVSSDPTPSTPVAPVTVVTGVQSCEILVGGTWTGDSLPWDYTTRQRGQVQLCNTDTSDPRVTGTWAVAVNCDYSLEGDIIVGQCQGTLRMESDSGGWEGTYTARTESSPDTADDIFHIIDADAIGSGDYAGLRYIHRLEGTDYVTITGHIGPVDVLGPPTTESP